MWYNIITKILRNYLLLNETQIRALDNDWKGCQCICFNHATRFIHSVITASNNECLNTRPFIRPFNCYMLANVLRAHLLLNAATTPVSSSTLMLCPQSKYLRVTASKIFANLRRLCCRPQNQAICLCNVIMNFFYVSKSDWTTNKWKNSVYPQTVFNIHLLSPCYVYTN